MVFRLARRAGGVLPLLAVGGLALQLAPDGPDPRGPCEPGTLPYAGFHAYNPDLCTAFCVPDGSFDGTCLGRVQHRRAWRLGPLREGNCKSLGYTEAVALDVMTQNTQAHLQAVGLCKGMRFTSFYKPVLPNITMAMERLGGGGVCRGELVAFEAVSPLYPGVCSAFCVPMGACEERAKRGKLWHLGITGEGNCVRRGYTSPVALGAVTMQTAQSFGLLQGPCRGMTISKFRRPEAPEVPEVHEMHEVPEVPEVHEMHEVPEAPEAPEVPEVQEVHEAPEAPEVPEVHEVHEVPEAPEVPEVHEVPEVPEVPEVNEEARGLR